MHYNLANVLHFFFCNKNLYGVIFLKKIVITAVCTFVMFIAYTCNGVGMTIRKI